MVEVLDIVDEMIFSLPCRLIMTVELGSLCSRSKIAQSGYQPG